MSEVPYFLFNSKFVETDEEKQHLMYARTKPPQIESSVPRKEVGDLLTFVYQEIYGDQFQDDKARNENYRYYLDEYSGE